MFPPPAAAATARAAWGGEARLEGFATSDLFPGGATRESDRGLSLDLQPQLTWRAAPRLRVRPWARLIVERYETWRARDLERWQLGLDLRRGPARLRAAYGWTSDELYFPASGGGAYLDRSTVEIEGRYQPLPDWQATVGVERVHSDFVPAYDERDDHRWIVRTNVERKLRGDARLAVTWLYRDTRSVTNLYSYAQNALRLEGAHGLPGHTLGEATFEFALRNYRTGQPYASNFGRQDDRWRARARWLRPVSGGARLEAWGEWRRTESTRLSKTAGTAAAGLAIHIQR